jgi:hypothetical protein
MIDMHYDFSPRGEAIRFFAIAAVTYMVQVAMEYVRLDYAQLLDWKKALASFVVGLVIALGQAFLAWTSHHRPHPGNVVPPTGSELPETFAHRKP